MLFCHIDYLDENFCVRKAGYVRVKGARIEAVSETPLASEEGEEVYDGRGKLLMPALVNAHAHAPMTLLRGWGENLNLQDWLNQRIFPFEAKLTDEAICAGTTLALAEMIRTGTVSSTEMYFGAEAMARALVASGAKMNLSVGVTCFGDGDLAGQPRQQEAERLIKNWNGAGEGRLVADLSLHAEYTSTPKAVRQMAQRAAGTGLNMQVHMAETKTETDECVERHGKTPARYFYDLGLFDAHTTAAHGVWLTDEDIPLLKEKDVTIASCPASNMKLASGFCRTPALLAAGVRVALGTDGAASNNNLDMFEEMKLFALAPKGAFGDPRAVSAQQALRAATLSGAQAQGRWDTGAVKAGNRADLIVLDCSAPWWTPGHDRAADIVYAAKGTDVCLTMADGRVLYRDGEYLTIDIERARHDAAAAAAAIAAQF